MKCLECNKEIPESFFAERAGSADAKRGRFNCPHCGADHARREIGPLPSGVMQYSVRLWGHPTTALRKKKKKEDEKSP